MVIVMVESERPWMSARGDFPRAGWWSEKLGGACGSRSRWDRPGAGRFADGRKGICQRQVARVSFGVWVPAEGRPVRDRHPKGPRRVSDLVSAASRARRREAADGKKLEGKRGRWLLRGYQFFGEH